jgi:cytochrome c5
MLSAVFLHAGAFPADFPQPGSFSNGAKVWAENCNRCHNMRGAAELRDDQWISSVYHMRLRAGLTGQETRDVITFLQASNTQAVPRSNSTGSSSATSQGSSGKAIYEKACVACHGTDGKGAFPGVSDFTSNSGPLSKSDDLLLRHITNGFQSPASPVAMPPKGGNPDLSEADIAAVLKHIRMTFGR